MAFLVRFTLALLLWGGLTGRAPLQGQVAPLPERGYPLFRNFTLEDYGTSAASQNWSVTQDARGLIYVANPEGVLEYDGVSWRMISADGAFVRVVLRGRDGVLYVGARNEIGYLAPDTTATPRYVSLRESIPAGAQGFGHVWSGGVAAGGVYFLAREVLFRWDGRRMHYWRAEEGTSFARAFVVRDALYVLQQGAGLKRVEGDALRLIPRGEQFAEAAIHVLLPHGDGLLMGVIDEGLYHYDGQRRTRFATEASAYLAAHELYHGTTLLGGGYALATLRGGVLILDEAGRTVQVLDEAMGLLDDDVKHLFVDAEGGLWLAMETGLARVEVRAWATLYDGRMGLEGAVVALERYRGRLYAGTTRGLFRLRHRGGGAAGVPVFERVAGVEEEVQGLYGFAGGLLVAAADGAHLVPEQGRSVRLSRRGDATVFHASQRNPGLVYVGHRDGLSLLRRSGGRWETEVRIAAFDGKEIYHLHEDDAGALWVGSYYDGLWRVTDGAALVEGSTAAYLTEEAGAPRAVRQLLPLGDGLRVVGDGRLLRPVVDEGSAVTFVPDSTVRRMLERDANVVHLSYRPGRPAWVFTEGDLYRVDPQPAGRWEVSKPMERMPHWPTYAVLLEEDGTFWMGGPKGIVRHDAAARSPLGPAPEVLLRQVAHLPAGTVRFGGGLVGAGATSRRVGPPRLAPFDNALRFTFAVPTFDYAKAPVTYQYFLEGFDKGWSGWTDEVRMEYTNLPPGAYRFRVRARAGSRETGEAVYGFTIMPPWYRSGWAYGLYGLLAFVVLTAAVQGAVRWRSASLERRNEELEAVVGARTAEVRAQQAQLQEQNVQLEAQALQLQEMDAIKSQFFANLSHEFRTPLTLTIGPLENALGGVYGSLTTTAHGQLALALRNARRLLRLINHLLDLSKLDAGKMRLAPARRDLVQFLRLIVSSFSSLASHREVALAFVPAADYVDACFDVEKLEQVFYNLLANAIKFTPAGGRVTVSVVLEGEEAVVTVADTGIGIPAAELPHIFDRFYQVNRSLTQAQEGTGIGLALVKSFVELHGGTVAVESIEQQETTVTVRLPVEVPAEVPGGGPAPGDSQQTLAAPAGDGRAADYLQGIPSVHARPASEGPPAAAATVLVADDNVEVQSYVQSCLQDHYRVVTVGDGEAALAEARVSTPDLILTDLMMPRMDGHALIRALRGDERLRHVPIVLLTARVSDDAKIEALEAGADDYLTKPFNGRELQARVKNLLRLHEQERTLQALNGELRQANEALWEASEAKTQLLGMAAHDLKNPLAAIRGFADVLLEDFGLVPEAYEFALLIRRTAQRMLDSVSELLDSVAIESGRVRLDRRPLDVAHLAERVVHTFQPQAQRKGQALTFATPAGALPLVEADEARLREAMANLVSNAIKYTPPGKAIRVRVHQEEEACCFTVHDEGPGLSEADQARLFQPFQRLAPQPTSGEPASGLGLYIVHQLMALHGGHVRAESQLGVGSAFTLVLPATEAIPR